MVTELITQTPLYVWFILVYLLIIGWRATKPRTIWVPQLFLISFILMISKFPKLLSISMLYTVLPWILGLLIGTLVGIKHKKIEILMSKNSIRLPGSYSTLIMLLTLFFIKYSLNVLQFTHPNWYTTWAHADTAVTFIFAGYSFSKATTYTLRFLRAKRSQKTI